MSGESTYKPTNAFTKWVDSRLPIIRLGYDSFVDFPTPKNLNYWYTFGGILMLCLVTQIVTGIILAMHYVPHISMAFGSVQRIDRDVNYGWLIQNIHSVGASMFFLAVYIHMFRGLYYGSYKAPREVLWILGVIIYVLMMAAAFLGYVLPWGQMSFWGATVITNLFGAIPVVGEAITQWMWGGYAVDNSTLNRFFSLHYLIPFLIAGVVVLHIWALHHVGNNNPTGLDVKSKGDTLPFHPYYTVKDGFAVMLFLLMFAAFVFYMPDALGHVDNYVQANPVVTPSHIVPEWYLLPFYAILRAVPDKLGGVILMFGAIFVLVILPWLDTSKVRSMRYRPIARQFFFIFVLVTFALGWCGAQSPDLTLYRAGPDQVTIWSDAGNGALKEQTVSMEKYAETKLALGESIRFSQEKPAMKVDVTLFGQILTIYYFAFFLLILPILGLRETPRKLPVSISDPVLPAGKVAAQGA
jgi:quinol-cytochrome oxidoreductase complex cytochrome b subunit